MSPILTTPWPARKIFGATVQRPSHQRIILPTRPCRRVSEDGEVLRLDPRGAQEAIPPRHGTDRPDCAGPWPQPQEALYAIEPAFMGRKDAGANEIQLIPGDIVIGGAEI